MNIIPHSPNIQYSSINQSADALRQQNQVRPTIPQTVEVKAYPPEKPISDADRLRNVSTAEQARPEETQQQASEQQTTINERGDERQDGRQQEQSAQREQQGDEQNAREQDSAQPTPEEVQEQRVVQELTARDKEVRQHEQTHDRVGGPYTGSPDYVYQRGPDGKNYAVEGSVSVDLSSIPGDPKATIAKMQRIRQAALAPASPSAQDQKVAATAQRIIAQQQMKLMDVEGELNVGEQAAQSASNQRLRGIEEAVFGIEEDRITEMNLRAIRINNFYQQATQPQATAQTIQV